MLCNLGKVVVCYFTNWPQWRSGFARHTTWNVDPDLCTQVMLSFGKVTNTGIAFIEYNDEGKSKLY